MASPYFSFYSYRSCNVCLSILKAILKSNKKLFTIALRARKSKAIAIDIVERAITLEKAIK